MAFPQERPRRLRRSATLRRLVRETTPTVDDLVLPLFVAPGTRVETPVASMPGVFQQSVDRATDSALRARDAGLPAVILFGIPPTNPDVWFSTWNV